MMFVRTNDLKPGMRLARPIYNRNGVLLYERDTRLTTQGIYSVRNFGLIGIYILEPAEPVPPMTEEDKEFERFQTMSVFTIKEIFENIKTGKKAVKLPTFVSELLKNYGNLDHKVNFMQNLRSKDDAIYKHSLNTAILAALISGHMDMTNQDQIKIIMAAILHESKFTEYSLDEEVKKTIFQMLHKKKAMMEGKTRTDINLPSEVLLVAYYYDTMTAMKEDEEPASELEAIRFLLDRDNGFLKEAVEALIDSINILTPGVCVELSDGGKGLVISENKDNILRPAVLMFQDNQVLDLYYDKVFRRVQIKDIMKSMDNRFVMDRELLKTVSE